MEPLLSLRGIGKSFLGSAALKGVDFDLKAGEIHALMGENGAGKSTLIKTLTGLYPPDTGSIHLDGREIHPASPADAVRLGVSTVYQEVNLAPNLTVMENIVLGREPRGPLGIRWAHMKQRAEAAISRLGVTLDVRRQLGTLPLALQQMVAIARAIDVDCKVLVLDEPTSSLDSSEVNALFSVMRKLRGDGIGIIFVTHFLDQVYAVSDRVTVLRNGTKVGTWDASQLSKLELVSNMIGRKADELEGSITDPSMTALGEQILGAKDLGRRGMVNQVNLSVQRGETLGLAGLLGSGRTETAKLLFGIAQRDSGQLFVKGKPVNHFRTRDAIRRGIGYLSEDRKHEGIFPELSVRENILVLSQVKKGWLRKIPLATQRTISKELVERLNVQPPDLERPVQFLSGGNQQKALIARWLAIEPDALILDEPTRGIDVGAKFEVMTLVESLRQKGSAFLFISSELAEVVRISTKVLVMRDRKGGRTLPAEGVSESTIVEEIAGA